MSYTNCSKDKERERREHVTYIEKWDTLQNAGRTMEKRKEKERRRLAREERARQQKREQELRFQRSLERARAPAHKKTGKPIMFRSNLPAKQVKRKGSNADEIADAAADRELEDFLARQY